MENEGLFVDFMYAVTVGATLPRVDEKVLHVSSALLWALLFLIAVFLEDFYLYHVKVVPNLHGFPKWRGFLLSMLIIAAWYLCQAAFPSDPRLFLISFGIFFLLKLLGGLLMKPTKYPSRQDLLFILPVAAAFVLAFFADNACFASHPGRLLIVLVPVWAVAVGIWWSMDRPVKVSV